MQEAHRNPAIRLCQNLRRYRRPHHLVAGGQDDLVALDAERPIENECLAVEIVAVRVLIGFRDDHATLAMLRHGPRQSDFDVLGRRIRIRHERVLARLGAAHHLEVQRRAEHGIPHTLIARSAAFANGIVEEPRPGSCGGNLVVNPEARRLGCQQLVAGVFVRLGLAQ